MANIIKIKRSAVTATPISLQEGELAYSENSSNLFIGTNGGVDVTKIGGNSDVLKLAGIEAGAQVNTVTSVNGQTGIVSLSIDDMDDVVLTTITNNDLLIWNNTLSQWQNIASTSVGVTDHLNLTNIGTTSHADIDTHIADNTLHFTMGSISITKSQVSDFVETDYVHTTGNEVIAGEKTFSNAMVINGDLTVNGTTTTIDSDNTTIADNIISLNFGELGAGVTLGTSGIEIDRGTLDNTQWIWNEATDEWGFKTGAAAFVPVSVGGHIHDASDITTGTFDDARIAETNVTQHEAALNHDNLLNFVANEHIDHSAVILTAGEGLSGGGDITASRTFAMDIPGLATETDSDGSADYMVIYDASTSTHKKILVNDILDGGNF